MPLPSSSSPPLSTATSMVSSNLPQTSASTSPSISPSQSFGDVHPFSEVMTVPPLIPTTPTKPVPPPAPQPCKWNPLASQTVVYPPKESCSKCVALNPPGFLRGGYSPFYSIVLP